MELAEEYELRQKTLWEFKWNYSWPWKVPVGILLSAQCMQMSYISAVNRRDCRTRDTDSVFRAEAVLEISNLQCFSLVNSCLFRFDIIVSKFSRPHLIRASTWGNSVLPKSVTEYSVRGGTSGNSSRRIMPSVVNWRSTCDSTFSDTDGILR